MNDFGARVLLLDMRKEAPWQLEPIIMFFPYEPKREEDISSLSGTTLPIYGVGKKEKCNVG